MISLMWAREEQCQEIDDQGGQSLKLTTELKWLGTRGRGLCGEVRGLTRLSGFKGNIWRMVNVPPIT